MQPGRAWTVLCGDFRLHVEIEFFQARSSGLACLPQLMRSEIVKMTNSTTVNATP